MDTPQTNKQRRAEKKQEKLLSEQASENKKRLMKISVVVGVFVIVIGVIAGIVMTRETATTVKDVTADPTVGLADSKVVVRVYEDYECPACAGVHPAIQDVIKEYKDRVKFVFNDFPLPQHKNATVAAVAAQCALGQNKYFEMEDALYTKQTEWAAMSNSRAQEIIRGYAEKAGMDLVAFDACVKTPEAAKAVKEDLEEGRMLGVNSTPSFFVNDERITTTPLSTNLRKAIDAQLAK